jgi:hypothetical protein
LRPPAQDHCISAFADLAGALARLDEDALRQTLRQWDGQDARLYWAGA